MSSLLSTLHADLLRATAAAGAAVASAVVSSARSAPAAAPGDPVDGQATDEALLGLLRGRSIQQISDVVDLLVRIDGILPAGDGLKAFNLLYLRVTEQVRDWTAFEDRPWILELDVLFAGFYFDGVETCLTAPQAAPVAWQTLMDRRYQPGVTAVQFALAGMSAHIIRDLAVAVVQTWQRLGPVDHARETIAFRDYLRINDVLDAVEPGAVRELATGLLAALDSALAPVDGWAVMAVIHDLRDHSWTHAENLAVIGLDTDQARAYVDRLDTIAADAGHAALLTL